MVQTELTQREILEKDFSSKLRGYDPQEVDEFLDIVIRDYKVFDDHIEDLQSENERISKSVNNMYKRLEAAMKKNEALNKQIEKLQGELKANGKGVAAVTTSSQVSESNQATSTKEEAEEANDHDKIRVIKSPMTIKNPISSSSKTAEVSSSDKEASKTQTRPSATIIDLLKRVSNLERAVFGEKNNDTEE